MNEKKSKISRTTELKREIVRILDEYQDIDFPISIHFNEGMECPDFKITIDKYESDIYIDGKGQKWKRVK